MDDKTVYAMLRSGMKPRQIAVLFSVPIQAILVKMAIYLIENAKEKDAQI